MSSRLYTVEYCAIVILAAGSSIRLGSPKQLLAYKGKSMLQHAAEVALQTAMRPLVVITGAWSAEIKEHMQGTKISIVENPAWQEGMASSLRCGLAEVQKTQPFTEAVIFMVCDQPYVSGFLLTSLLSTQHESGLPIVASNYGTEYGTPVLFHKIFFDELMKLKGDAGARRLIKKHEGLVATVAFPEGAVDIDTMRDYEALPQ